MDRLIESFAGQWEGVIEFAPRALLALVVFLIFVVVGRLAVRGLGLVLNRGGLPPTHQLFFRRLLNWAAVLFGMAVALNVLGLGGVAAGLLAGGGLTAVMLGFAFRQIGENLLSGLFLAFSRPFSVAPPNIRARPSRRRATRCCSCPIRKESMDRSGGGCWIRLPS